MCEKHSLEALKTRLFLDVLSQEQGTSTEIEREKEPDFVQLKCRRQQYEWYGLAILLTWYIFLPQYGSTVTAPTRKTFELKNSNPFLNFH
jgi:hypothetical protein